MIYSMSVSVLSNIVICGLTSISRDCAFNNKAAIVMSSHRVRPGASSYVSPAGSGGKLAFTFLSIQVPDDSLQVSRLSTLPVRDSD